MGPLGAALFRGQIVGNASSPSAGRLQPGQHAGLPVRAGAPALGKSLSVKGRLMKKLRMG